MSQHFTSWGLLTLVEVADMQKMYADIALALSKYEKREVDGTFTCVHFVIGDGKPTLDLAALLRSYF